MKKLSLIPTAFVLIAIMVTSCGVNKKNKSTTTDTSSNESTSSNEVTIGKQVWMTKNLDVDKFRDGSSIPEAKTDEEWKKAGKNKQPAWCYYNNDPANGAKYGKLYNWYAVNDSRGLAPVGYHIP
ncbi:MAG: FISUMP domain-containing protein, partial [Sphingomonadales bacterium]